MSRTEKCLVAFLCALLTGCLTLGGMLIWLNAAHPVQMAPACPTASAP
jgi:hypothetical protein